MEVMQENNPLLLSVGNLFLSLSATLVWGGYILAPRPHLFIISTISACFYCVAQMLSAAFWFAIPPLKQTYPWVLFLTVTIQEVFRLLMYVGFVFMMKFGPGVKAFIREGSINVLQTGFAVGLGYALLSVLISYTSVVADNYWFDQSIYMPACPDINFFTAGASFALAYSIMHMCLALCVWPIYNLDYVPAPDKFNPNPPVPPTPEELKRLRWQKYIGAFVVYLVHLGLSEAALGNRNDNGCTYTTGIVWGLVALLGIATAVSSVIYLKREDGKEKAALAKIKSTSSISNAEGAQVVAEPTE